LILPIEPVLINDTPLSIDYFNGLKNGVAGTPLLAFLLLFYYVSLALFVFIYAYEFYDLFDDECVLLNYYVYYS
jgi:hypothetical protein